MDHIKELDKVCDTLVKELSEKIDAYEKGGNKMTAGDLEMIDKMSHALKENITSIAMLESDERNIRGGDREFSNRMSHSGDREFSNRMSRSSDMDYSNRMGHSSDMDYSNRTGHNYWPYEGYSRNSGSMVDSLRDMMMKEHDDSIRRDIQRLIDRMEMSR